MKVSAAKAPRLPKPLRWALWTFFCAVVCVTGLTWSYFFPPTTAIDSRATLQAGQKMIVRAVFKPSHWRGAPDRLSELDVWIDGKQVPVSAAAVQGLGLIDPARTPQIAEVRGFPEVTLWARDGESFHGVRFRFLNYSFSERFVDRDRREPEAKAFDSPHPPPVLTRISPEAPPVFEATLTADRVQPSSPTRTHP